MFNNSDEVLLEVMKEILETQRVWTDKMLELETERLRLERLRLEGAQAVPDVPTGMLRISEEQQDADWALQNKIISPEEYKDLLSQAGLTPSDIEFV